MYLDRRIFANPKSKSTLSRRSMENDFFFLPSTCVLVLDPDAFHSVVSRQAAAGRDTYVRDLERGDRLREA